jgi:hypothetical protein
MHGFKGFAEKNGGSALYLDEELVLQKEVREEVIFWGSVYGSRFVEMPDNSLTSESAYRTWCWKTSGMMPEKRNTREFDKYIRPRMEAAEVRESLPGTEYGAEVDAAIEDVLRAYCKSLVCIDDGEEIKINDIWLETLDEKRGLEVVLKIKWLMKRINERESYGNTEGKIKRKDVCKRLVYWGRKVGDREASINRHRSAYALPLACLEEGFDAIQIRKANGGPG